MIRSAKIEDASQIAEIYNYYILNSIATFEETPVDADEMKRRMGASNSKSPWIVYEISGRVVAYAYAGAWKPRSAYKRTAEISIYLKDGQLGKGIGSTLYAELMKQLTELNFHAIIGGVSLPNEASVLLHERLGFEKVAHFKEVGFKFGKWIDVGYWELLINQG